MVSLNSPLNEIERIGSKTGAILKKLGLSRAQDLLFYFPFRYEDFATASNISSLQAGDSANITGEIELIQGKKSFRRKMFIVEALINDGEKTIKAIWFNQPYLAKTLKVGDKISLAGKITESYGQLSMVSPEYEKIASFGFSAADEKKLIHTKGLVPIYHLSEGVSQKQMRYFIKSVIPLADKLPEWLPEKTRRNLNLIPLGEAIKKIHSPKKKLDIEKAQQRLAFSELFLRQIRSQIIKQDLAKRQAPKITFQEEATRKFVSSLPFQLTKAQKKSAWEILRDIEKERPMSRLLEGDVGSGKTAVAALALFSAAINGKKSALMVPSEILAKQHFKTISRLFTGYAFKIALRTRSYKEGDMDQASIVIGTQALIQDKIGFNDFSLVIVDEQHRFGVNQRKKILDMNRRDGISPHFLSLTATPIPRSLAIAIYGDLDLSIIDEMPPGRKETVTKIVKEKYRPAAYDFIKEKIRKGRQAFFVYPLIDESDKAAFKSVKAEYEKMANDDFKEFKVSFIHGKLKKDEKEKIMRDFSEGKTDILLATSVIEVGIDIPNATIIAIESADRFGLAQLHQFRGRVNRSDKQSFCFLFLSKEEISNKKTIERLEALTKYKDGLSLAKIDLKLRGAGEIFGSIQSGFSDISLASIFDYKLIKKAQEEAGAIIKNDSDLVKYPMIKAKLGEFEKDFHLE